jgi:TPR repeat protein
VNVRIFIFLVILSGFSIATADASVRLHILKKDALGGKVQAQFELAQTYETGEWGEPDPDRAYKWYLKAAEQNHTGAQLAVGECYARGFGVERHGDEAYNWISKSAERYYAPAQLRLGLVYFLGDLGHRKNEQKALLWIRRAASQNYIDALVWLGDYYSNGDSKNENVEKAVAYYLQASDQGSVDAQLAIARNYDAWSEFLEGRMTAFECLQQLAKAGNAEAQYNLGAHYSDLKPDPDMISAMKWLRLSAEQGNADAKRRLAGIYLTSKGALRDVPAAMEIYAALARAGDVLSQETLGKIFAGDFGHKPNLPVSAKWFLEAAKNGSLDAQIKCVFIYGKGSGMPQDRSEAYAWSKIVAKSGKNAYQTSLEPVLTVEEKINAEKRYRALQAELRSRVK